MGQWGFIPLLDDRSGNQTLHPHTIGTVIKNIKTINIAKAIYKLSALENCCFFGYTTLLLIAIDAS